MGCIYHGFPKERLLCISMSFSSDLLSLSCNFELMCNAEQACDTLGTSVGSRGGSKGGGGVLGVRTPPPPHTHTLHEEGKNVVHMHANKPHFST